MKIELFVTLLTMASIFLIYKRRSLNKDWKRENETAAMDSFNNKI